MNVLILGNGFDLDVNYKTRYSDFAKNVRLCWPFEDAKDGLGGYLQERAKTDTWLDLESALLDYASATDGVAKKGNGGLYPLEDDKEDFQRLVHTLRMYIARMIDEPPVNKDSVAAQVLGAVLKSSESVSTLVMGGGSSGASSSKTSSGWNASPSASAKASGASTNWIRKPRQK